MTAGDQGWGNAPTPQNQAPYTPPPAAGPFIAFGPLLITIAIFTLVTLLGSVSQSLGVSLVVKENPDMLAGLAVIGTAWCGCAMLLDLLSGMFYAFLYKRSNPVDLGRGAAGGAIGGAVTRFIVTLTAGLLSLLLYPTLLYGASPEEMGAVIGVGLGSLAFSTCLWTFGGAALGAIGGLIGGLIWQPK